MMWAMFTASDLACSRGERRLFEGLAFELQRGEWLHVKGENGSGKTTLLRTLIGLSSPDAGEIRWQGRHTRDNAVEYRRAFVYLGHQAGLKEDLTPLENLRLALALDGFAADDEHLLDALRRMGLHGREDLAARHLSAGQKRRVLLARLLLRPADLWVLDEPFTALDKPAVEMLSALIATHLEGGGLAVLTSHQPIHLAGGHEVQL
jgi:heme exporter protein A